MLAMKLMSVAHNTNAYAISQHFNLDAGSISFEDAKILPYIVVRTFEDDHPLKFDPKYFQKYIDIKWVP